MTKSLALLFLATILWGSSFASTSSLLQVAGPFTIVGSRFLLASVLILFFIPFHRLKNFYRLPYFGAGFLIFTMIACQTLGLQTTSAGTTAFITCLYVVIVPVLDLFVFKNRIPILHFLWVFLSLIGMGLILDLALNQFTLTSGALWTLGSAFLGAGHILWIGHFANREDPMELHFGQCLWTGILGGVFALVFNEKLTLESFQTFHWIHFAVLTVGVSFFAFYLQISAQQKISSTLASLIFLLEAPFAPFFGWMLLRESMTSLQMLGGLVILASCTLAIWTAPKATPTA